MNRTVKWIVIGGGVFFGLVIVALLIIPMFVDIQEYKPVIEKKVSEAAGRPFTIGGDLSLSLFPWAAVSFSDLRLGNPEGFSEEGLLAVKSFDVRVKLFPLLFRDIQIKSFLLRGARIVLEKNKAGKGNWEELGQTSKKAPEPTIEKGKPPEKEFGEEFPIKSLAVGELEITDCSLLWVDHAQEARKEVSAINLRLRDVSLDRPIRLVFSALVDGQPLQMEGTVGPLGDDPRKGAVPLDLTLKALKHLELRLKGQVADAASLRRFDLTVQVPPFSPRKVMAALEKPLPLETADPGVLGRAALKANVEGDSQRVSLSEGLMELDDSRLEFSLNANEFEKPYITFDLSLDRIDLDRYLPPPAQEETADEKKPGASDPKREKKDYTALRRLVMKGALRAAEMKARGIRVEDLSLKVSGKNGRFRADPLTLKLYQGDLSGKGLLDVSRDIPRSKLDIRAKDVQVNPLLRDFMEKDFLEGTFRGALNLAMAGDDAENIKRTLNGEGDLIFADGAIKGIDLTAMVQNVEAAFGLAEKGEKRPRTDFSKFHVPFRISNGVFITRETALISPLLRVDAAGKANLVEETLDFRVNPKFVASLKGQGDRKDRTGVAVPVLVSGSFSSPSFRPDLERMLQKELSEPTQFKGLLDKLPFSR